MSAFGSPEARFRHGWLPDRNQLLMDIDQAVATEDVRQGPGLLREPATLRGDKQPEFAANGRGNGGLLSRPREGRSVR